MWFIRYDAVAGDCIQIQRKSSEVLKVYDVPRVLPAVFRRLVRSSRDRAISSSSSCCSSASSRSTCSCNSRIFELQSASDCSGLTKSRVRRRAGELDIVKGFNFGTLESTHQSEVSQTPTNSMYSTYTAKKTRCALRSIWNMSKSPRILTFATLATERTVDVSVQHLVDTKEHVVIVEDPVNLVP